MSRERRREMVDCEHPGHYGWPPETRATQLTLAEALDLLANTIGRLKIEFSPSVEITGMILNWPS